MTTDSKRVLTYVLVALAGGLNLLNGLQQSSTFLTVAGGTLAVIATGLLVVEATR